MTDDPTRVLLAECPGYRCAYYPDRTEIESCRKRIGLASGGTTSILGTEWHTIKPIQDSKGYPVVSICRGGDKAILRKVHCLALEAKYGPCPPGMQTRHLNGNPSDTRLDNLRRGTAMENAADRERHGRTSHMPGEKNPHARLTDNDIRDIRIRLASGETGKSIAQRHGVSRATVSYIKNKRRWSCVL